MPDVASADTTDLVFNNETETSAFAGALAMRLRAGDVILLSGEIGAGKSFLARAAIKALMAASGVDEDVPSPTFTLVQTYEFSDLEVWHADLYRLGDASEVLELGLWDAFATAVCFVEWPDRLSDIPKGALRIELASADAPGVRTARLIWTDPRWSDVLSGLLSA